MTTLTVFADTSDNWISSTGASYSDGREGTGSLVLGSASGVFFQTGQQTSSNEVSQGFISFDTSSIGSDVVSAATLTIFTFDGSANTTTHIAEAWAKDWGAAVDTGDFVAGSALSGLTKLATFDTAGLAGLHVANVFTSESAFPGAINRTGSTRILIASDHQRTNTAPSGNERVLWDSADTGGTTADPKLVVVHAPAAQSEARTLVGVG